MAKPVAKRRLGRQWDILQKQVITRVITLGHFANNNYFPEATLRKNHMLAIMGLNIFCDIYSYYFSEVTQTILMCWLTKTDIVVIVLT